jgi:Protein of unknown function (DUF2577).
MSDLLDAIKMAGKGVNEASKPVELTSGQVTSISPLAVKIDQKLTIPEKLLILTDAARDYHTEITLAGLTDSGGDSVSGRSVVMIHNALRVGESVLLLRMQGGQKYMIIGRGNLA